MIKKESEHKMMNENSIDTSLLLKVYDAIRVVNPLEKSVIDDEFVENEKPSCCYDIWDFGRTCENCISTRALQENRTVMKFEYTDEKLYMVTAIPDPSKRQVLELLRDVTNEHLLEGMRDETSEKIMEKLKKLNQEVVTDGLTNVYNRRFLRERLPYELIKAYQDQYPISIVMLDVDYFKHINDDYGHPTGDQVLIELATVLKNWIREETDWVVRYGGEEFLLFMQKISSKMLKERMEALRLHIEELIFCKDTHQIKLTVSMGLLNQMIVNENGIEKGDDFIHLADEALYTSKKNGRNQCTMVGAVEEKSIDLPD
ncbi:GGDEF domain-containing protein [Eubacteriaceae bacterium ES3]|nr:GGDEF domain-containing protein [Eubacteriaceae bacterium ES3]